MIYLEKLKVIYKPFPHLVFSDAIDDQIYKEICEDFDVDKKYFTKQPLEDKLSGNLKMEKYTLSTDHGKIYPVYCSKRNNLKKFLKYLLSKQFQLELKKKFLENNIDLGCNFEQNDLSFFKKIKNILKPRQFFYDKIELSALPLNGGYINPHTDGPNKLFTLIIPIVNDISEFNLASNYSTDILENLDAKDSYNYANRLIPKNKTKIINQIKFEKKQILCLIKTHNSLHSVGPINYSGSDQAYRRSINFFKCKNIY